MLLLAIVVSCSPATSDESTTTMVGSSSTTTLASTTTALAAFPATISDDSGSVTIQQRPERIVSLSPTGTEMLFAIGAGLQVVAVDSFSYYPSDAPVTDLSGFQPNLEAILAFEPDLVLASYDPEGVLSAGLSAVNVPLIVFDTAKSVDGVYEQMRALGVATGNFELADKVADDLEAELGLVVSEADDVGEGVTYLHDVGFPFVASSFSFAGQIFNLFGMVNIADQAPGAEFGFPEISDEYVVDADPEIIFLSFETPVADRPGWAQISAVVNDHIFLLDPDTSSRWGPRIVDFARDIGAAIAALGED